jgi:hypothetical protein
MSRLLPTVKMRSVVAYSNNIFSEFDGRCRQVRSQARKLDAGGGALVEAVSELPFLPPLRMRSTMHNREIRLLALPPPTRLLVLQMRFRLLARRLPSRRCPPQRARSAGPPLRLPGYRH